MLMSQTVMYNVLRWLTLKVNPYTISISCKLPKLDRYVQFTAMPAPYACKHMI